MRNSSVTFSDERYRALRAGGCHYHVPMHDRHRLAGSYHRLGVVREREEDWVGAVAAFEAAAELDPSWAARHYRLGNAREQSWDLAGACRAYATAVALAPHHRSWSQRLARTEVAAAEFRRFDGLVIAHRGSVAGRPENTLAGLAELPATVSGVEVDVRLSRDGVAMLMHDAELDRTTAGEGQLADLTHKELLELGVPTLAEYLTACAAVEFRRILLDIKSPTRSVLRTVAAVARDSPVADRCVVLVRGERPLYEFREIADDLRLGAWGRGWRTWNSGSPRPPAATRRCS